MKTVIQLLFLTNIVSSPVYSQITFKNVEKSIEKEVLKPPPYDSLKNFKHEDENFNNYLQYIGLKVFLPPCKTNIFYSTHPSIIRLDKPVNGIGVYKADSAITYVYKPIVSYSDNDKKEFDERETEILTDGSQVGNRYYTVLDVLNQDSLIQLKAKMSYPLDHEALKNRNLFTKYIREFLYSGDELGFILKDDLTNDTLYSMGGLDRFILVPYFTKQKEMFEGKTFVALIKGNQWQNNMPNFKDLTTNKEIKLENGSKWKCEVTLMQRNKVEPEDNKPNYLIPEGWEIYYVFKNDKNQTVAIDNQWTDSIVPHVGISGNGGDYTFMIEKVFIERENEKKLRQAELLAKQKREEQIIKERQKLDKEKHLKNCIDKFGSHFGNLIAQGKVTLGMTKKMCKAAWGEPFDKFKTTTSSYVSESWYYSWKRSLHFENGTLTRIEE